MSDLRGSQIVLLGDPLDLLVPIIAPGEPVVIEEEISDVPHMNGLDGKARRTEPDAALGAVKVSSAEGGAAVHQASLDPESTFREADAVRLDVLAGNLVLDPDGVVVEFCR